jgi:hypothetical protein
MSAPGSFASAPAIAASNWGDVNMSTTPDTETTTVRPAQSSLITHVVAVATLLAAEGC